MALRDARAGTRGRFVGVVETTGRTLTAPLTRRECIAWVGVAVPVDQFKRLSRRTAEDVVEFMLVDGSERALVRVDRTTLALAHEPFAVDRRSPMPIAVRRFIDARELATTSPIALSEGVIGAGDRVAVIGTLRERSGATTSGDYRSPARAGTRELEILAERVSNRPNLLE